MYQDGALRVRFGALRKVGYNDELAKELIDRMSKTYIDVPSNKTDSQKRTYPGGHEQSQRKRPRAQD